MAYPRQKASSSALLLNPFEHRLVLQAKHVPNSKRVFMIQDEVIEKLLPKVFILRQSLEKRQRLESPSVSSTLASAIADPTSSDDPSTHRFYLTLLNEVNPSYYRIFVEDLSIHHSAEHMREIRVNMKQATLEKGQQLILARQNSWQDQYKRIRLRHKWRKYFVSQVDRLTALFIILKMEHDVVNLMRLILRHHQLPLQMQLEHRVLHLLHQPLSLALGLSSLSLDCTDSLTIQTVCTLLWLEVVYFAISAWHDFCPLQIFKIVQGDLAGTLLTHITNELGDDLEVIGCISAR